MRSKAFIWWLASASFWIRLSSEHALHPELYLPCSDGRSWRCIAKKVDRLSVDLFKDVSIPPDDPSELSQQVIYEQKIRKPINFFILYLNKINSLDGSFYVSARVKVEIRQGAMLNATGLALQFVPNDDKKKTVSYEAKLTKKMDLPPQFAVDMVFHIENSLEFGTNYTLRFALLPLKSEVWSETQVEITDYKITDTDCDSDGVEAENRQREASRWTSAIKEVIFFPHQKAANVTFYGAPKGYCIDSYAAQVVIGEKILPDPYIISSNDMTFSHGVVTGNVTLTNITLGQNYSVRITPFNSKNKCVCKNVANCACVTIGSEIFVFPSLNNPSEKYPNQILNIRIVDDRVYNTRDTNSMLMIILVLGTCLGIVSILLALIVWRGKEKRGFFLIMKPSGLSMDSSLNVPMIRRKTSTVLILNAESQKNSYIGLLVDYLTMQGINVFFAPRDVKAIENNLQLWCLRVVQDADKIMFFHSDRMAQLLWRKGVSDDLFNTVFCTLLPMIDLNDKRVIHVTWGSGSKKMFTHTEIAFEIPRDLHHLIKSVSNTIPTKNTIRTLQEKYREVENNINQAPEEVKGAMQMSIGQQINHKRDLEMEPNLDITSDDHTLLKPITDVNSEVVFVVTKRHNYNSDDSGVHMMGSEDTQRVRTYDNDIEDDVISSLSDIQSSEQEDNHNNDSGILS